MKPPWISLLYRNNRREFNFVGRVLIYFMVCQGIYSLGSPIAFSFLTEKLTASVSSSLINIMSGDEHVRNNGTAIQSPYVSLNIGIGCDGVEGMIIVIAFICAYPMPLKRKLYGLAVGVALIYMANLVRVIGLYYTLKHTPGFFPFMHIYVGQVFTVFIGLVFFLGWVGRRDEKTASNP